MKAIVHHEYGPPDVLKLEEVPKPIPGDGEVLVDVQAASTNAADWHLMRADPFVVRLMFGLFKPKHKILGADIAGRVEAVGSKVTQFRPGDEVFGDLADSGFGAFAEYACVPERALVSKPNGMSFDEAAAVPLAGLAALQGLRDKGGIQRGQKVLIHGASGGVGTFAVQIAKSFGAEVTGVCSTTNVDLVRSIGADDVIDYKREDVTQGDRRFDLILDAAAFRSPLAYQRVLHPKGVYVMVGGAASRMFQLMFLRPWVGMTGKKKMIFLDSRPNQKDLTTLKDLIEAGKVAPVIDRRYPLSEVPDAIRYMEKGHARGKVIITM